MRALARTVAEGRAGTLRLRLSRVAPVIAGAALALALPASAGAHHHHKRASISISNASVHEPDGSATAAAVFDVKLSHKKHHVVKASYKTVAGSAGANDFRAKSGVVKFKPGKRHAHIRVVVTGDNQHESDETFSVKLSHSVRAHMKRRTGVATIVDNDPAGGGGGGGGHNNPPDTDGDGIPDGLDACPHDSDPDGYCPQSVYEVNDGTVGPGSRARVNGLMVTAIDRPDDLAWVGAQPGDPGYQGVKYSALTLVDDGGIPVALAIGDRVSVSGRTASGEFDVTSLDIKSSGGTPDVASLTDANVGNSKYAGVLGSIGGETLTTPRQPVDPLLGHRRWQEDHLGPARALGRRLLHDDHGHLHGTRPAIRRCCRARAPTSSTASRRRARWRRVHMTDACVNVDETGAQIAVVKLSGPASVDTSVPASSDDPSAVTPDQRVRARGHGQGNHRRLRRVLGDEHHGQRRAAGEHLARRRRRAPGHQGRKPRRHALLDRHELARGARRFPGIARLPSSLPGVDI